MHPNDTPNSPPIATELFPAAATALIAKRLLARHKPREIADAIEVLVDLLDLMGGDADAEDNGDAEQAGDEQDAAWIEWLTLHGSKKRGPNIVAGHEDGEDDDPAEEDDPSGQCDEDGINTGGWQSFPSGPGCGICDDGLADSDALVERLGGTRHPSYGIDQSKGPTNDPLGRHNG